MITPNQIRNYLQAQPFVPFRIFLSDGSSHEVPHPEFAWVFGSTVYVGVPGTAVFPPNEYVKQLAIMHITRVEKLPAEKT